MIFEEISKNIFTIENFLNPDECETYIRKSEEIGYKTADVDLGKGKRRVISNIRTNERVDIDSQEMADKLWQKLSALKLPTYEELVPQSLSSRLRFYKYTKGQKFNMHKDGMQKFGELSSYFTFMVFLNSVSAGGETVFRQDNLKVIPTLGKALIFEHSLWHSGSEVTDSNKYVLRSDILYQ